MRNLLYVAGLLTYMSGMTFGQLEVVEFSFGHRRTLIDSIQQSYEFRIQAKNEDGQNVFVDSFGIRESDRIAINNANWGNLSSVIAGVREGNESFNRAIGPVRIARTPRVDFDEIARQLSELPDRPGTIVEEVAVEFSFDLDVMVMEDSTTPANEYTLRAAGTGSATATWGVVSSDRSRRRDEFGIPYSVEDIAPLEVVFELQVTHGSGLFCQPNTTGDVNGDGFVDFPDFLIVSSNFDHSFAIDGHQKGDMDCSGIVDFTDFLTISDAFGNSTTDIVGVPEPDFRSPLFGFCASLAFCRRKPQERLTTTSKPTLVFS